MKEYQTIKVRPYEETNMIQYMETFGWKLDETREIYNESQEVVGSTVTVNNSFMQGFTGNDANVKVQTRTNVTHYLNMRFSRDTNMKHYDRISALQSEFESLDYLKHKEMPSPPIVLTLVAIFGFATIILPVMAIVSWKRYPKEKAEVIAFNEKADMENERIKKRLDEIWQESIELTSGSCIA